jgi:hypothetical protein
MMEPITFKCTPTKEDYVQVIRAFHLSSRSKVRSSILFLLLAIVYLSFVPYFLPLAGGARSGTAWYPVLFPLLCISFFLLTPAYWFFIGPYLTGRKVQKHERLREEMTYYLDDHEVRIIGEKSELKLDWGAYRNTIEVKHHYLLVHRVNKQMFQFIPRRAFESEEQEAAFRRLVEQHLGKIKSTGFFPRLLRHSA